MGEATETSATPASELGKSHIAMPNSGANVNCPGCEAPASKTSKFCGQCGARLWEPCLDCGELNSVSERFCGGCGGDLAGKLSDEIDQAAKTLEEAAKLAEFGKLIDAVQMLEALTFGEHSQLDELRATVTTRIGEYRTRREQIVDQATDVLSDVKRLVAELRYADALAEANKIPPALRNAELSDLHDQVTAKVVLATRLREELHAGVTKKQYDGLVSVAAQLAGIDPHDAAVKKLLSQLQTWQAKSDTRTARELIGAAAEALAKNAYSKAESLLARVPLIDDVDLEKKYRAAKERVWTANQMATAPYVSSHTVAAAGRLIKLQPGDQEVKKFAAQLNERWKVTSAQNNGVPAVWVKSPEQCLVARQVDVCPLPTYLVDQCKLQKVSPHEMVVAFGLALQSAGLATVPLNLMPTAKGSWRDKLKLGGRRDNLAFWGVDLGGHGLKAIRLESPSEPEAPPVICDVVVIRYSDLDNAVSTRDGELPEPVRHAIAEFGEKNDLSQSHITVNLSGPQTLGRFFSLPVPSSTKFNQAIEYEARARVPLPPENVVFDHYSEELPETGEVPTRWVTLVAANRKQVEQRMQPFVEQRCGRLQVASSSVAVVNASLAKEGVAEDRSSVSGGLAVVDIGGSSTNISVVTPNSLWFRGLYLGGDSMAEAIAKQLKVDRSAAVKFCRRPEAAPWMHQIEEALLPVYEDLTEQLRRSLEQCRADTEQAIDRMVVTGSEAQSLGLVRYLRMGK